ncbi:hypothetical protein ACHAXS_004033 [Conticribra weissflogii]
MYHTHPHEYSSSSKLICPIPSSIHPCYPNFWTQHGVFARVPVCTSHCLRIIVEIAGNHLGRLLCTNGSSSIQLFLSVLFPFFLHAAQSTNPAP